MSDSTAAILTGPEWVMIGVRQQHPQFDGVAIYASNEIGEVALRAVMDDPEPAFYGAMWRQRASRIRRVDLQGSMKTYVVAMGADYAEAVRHLFDHWNPGTISAVTP